MPSKLTTAVLLLLFPALLSCVSETKTSGPLVWVDEVSYGGASDRIPNLPNPGERPAETDAPPAAPPPSVVREEDPGKMVQVQQKLLDELFARINRPQMLLGNRIVVDATRIPFKPTIIPIADPNYVETREFGNPTGDDHAFLMRSRQKVALVERDRPRVRVGEGIDLLADGEIHVRYHRRVSKKRPVYLRVSALGNAVYRDEISDRRIEGDSITLVVELVSGPDGLILEHSVE